VERPIRFAHYRWLGDKRSQVVYDLDTLNGSEASVIDELIEAGTYAAFAPDTLAEARNRGYRPYISMTGK